MSEATAFERVESHNELLKSGEGKVQPGQPMNLSPALASDQAIAQGDFYLRLVDGVPEGYVLAEEPSVQLVQGETIGAKHCLDSLDGVQVFLPPTWGEDENTNGPVLVIEKGANRELQHPKHGNISLPDDCTLDTWYQRAFDEESKRERRARD